ncbi:hypothetical protein BY996DRAFT_4153012 [Phakopsora pachyrhizi]|nr:hypothetical protein BY996DRAFT_4153012 [Phakopsora pachyrhizi]
MLFRGWAVIVSSLGLFLPSTRFESYFFSLKSLARCLSIDFPLSFFLLLLPKLSSKRFSLSFFNFNEEQVDEYDKDCCCKRAINSSFSFFFLSFSSRSRSH